MKTEETRKIECHQVKSKAHLLPPKKYKWSQGRSQNLAGGLVSNLGEISVAFVSELHKGPRLYTLKKPKRNKGSSSTRTTRASLKMN